MRSLLLLLLLGPLHHHLVDGGAFVPASGNALRFIGDRVHRHYVSITPRCHADGNPFDHANLTVAVWFRSSTLTTVEQSLFGFAFAGGPQISLQRDGSPNYQGIPVLIPGCARYMPNTNLVDGQWHHIAVSNGPNYFGFYIDGRVQVNCSGSIGIIKRTDTLIMGVFDMGLDSANAQPFTGDLDDARLYRRLFVHEQDVYDDIMQRPPSDDELRDDLLVVLDFDADQPGAIQNRAPIPTAIQMGGGLVQRSPSLVPSTAPLFTLAQNATLILDAIQDTDAGYGPTTRRSLMAITPRYNTSASEIGAVDVVVHTVATVSGTLSIGGIPLQAGLTLSSLMNAEIVFDQVLGVIGHDLIRAWITVQESGSNTTQDVIIVAHARPNWRPIAGSAGNAAQFDGIDDFYMAEHLAWPKKSAIINGQPRLGLSAITVEFWSWIDAGGEGDRAVFALGGNTEVVQPWVDKFNRQRTSGRWHVTLPDGTGAAVWQVGDAVYQTAARPYYSGWAHFAFVHDGIEGDHARVYVNGDLVLDQIYDHDKDGILNGHLDFNHMTIGTWTFWSEVYHRGIVDDFRLWNTSRTGDQIRRHRYTQLTGREPDLFAYWSFDGDEGGTRVRDRTGHGYDMVAGGCVTCEPRFYCQPYHPDPIELGPDSCIPSAKSSESPFYRTATCFGGTICFKGDERAATHPALIPSGAPIGGHTFEQFGAGGKPVEIVLNGTDPDGDRLRFTIESMPGRGSLQYRDVVTGQWIGITSAPVLLPDAVQTIRLLSSAGDGGHPFATIQFSAHDGIRSSEPVQVEVSLVCGRGTFLNAIASRCDPCPPGTFTQEENVSPSCTLCALNEFQPSSGQTSCFRCTPGVNYADGTGAATCTPCNATDATAVNPTRLPMSASFCAVDLVADNDVSRHGGRHAELDFGALLPPGTDPTQARIVLTTIPQHGRLYQLQADGTLGDNFNDYFFASVDVQEQWVRDVIHASDWLPDRSPNQTRGEADVFRPGSSPRAWAAFDGDNGVADLIVRYATPVYVTGVVVYENVGGGAVTHIEALDPDGVYQTLWTGDPLPVGLLTLRQFAPPICPTPFLTDTLRLTVNALKCAGRNEIDAIKLLGATSLKKTSSMLIQDAALRVGYVPPTISSVGGSAVPLGYRLTDSISYRVHSCLGGDVLTSGVQTLQVTLGASNIVDLVAPDAVVAISVILAAIGIIACLASAALVFRFRTQPIIRASSVFFMNLMLLGMGSGFLVLLLTGLDAARPGRLPQFCTVRSFLFSIGFVLIMGSIVVKTARIVFIFVLARGQRIVKLSNYRLLAILSLMMGVDFAFLLGAVVIDPLRDTVVSTETERYHVCASASAEFLINASIGFKVFLVLIGLALVLIGRNVPSTFNEVKALSFMAYTIATNAMIYILSRLVSDEPSASVLVMTFTMSVALFSILGILVVYKFYVVLFRPDQNTVNTTNNQTGTTPGQFSHMHKRAISMKAGPAAAKEISLGGDGAGNNSAQM